MKGELAEGIVPGLLRELYVGRGNGTLRFVRGSEEQSIRVHRGHIVNARTNVVEDRLGEILVRHGRLSEEDLARATEVVIRDKKRLGEVLVELELLDQTGLEEVIALRVREMLAKVFTWDEGTYSFEEEQEAAGELTLRLSTGELILEAVRAIRDPDVVRYALGDMKRVLTLSSDPLLRFQQLPLSPNDGFVLSRVDGVLSAREIEKMIPLPAEEVRRSLLGLLSTGVIEYRPASERTRPHHADGEAPQAEETASPLAPKPDTGPVEPLPETPASSAAAQPPADDAGEDTAPVEEPPLSLPADAFTWPAAEPDSASAGTSATTAPPDEATAERRREIEEAWGGLRSKNHFEILGLSRRATAADVKGAYFSLARRFHPDVHHGASLGDMRDKLEAVFIRLGEAYEVLRDQGKRSDYEERLGRPRPQPTVDPEPGAPAAGAAPEVDSPVGADHGAEAVQRAERLYTSASEAEDDAAVRQKYWEAIQLVEPVLPRLAGGMRLRARLVLARCYVENPNWVKRAEETLQAAVRDEPEDAEAYRLLGELYEERGLRTRATSMFRRVLELKPDDTKAAEALARIATANEPPPPEAGGGLLRKIFRRS